MFPSLYQYDLPMSPPKSLRLAKSMLIEIVDGRHLPNRRFLTRRRVESTWGVSNRTADAALGRLIDDGVLLRVSRKETILAPDCSTRARDLMQQLPPIAALPVQMSDHLRKRGDDCGELQQRGIRGLKYERLAVSLLMEIAGGSPMPSRRATEHRWNVSRATVERAQSELFALGVTKRDPQGRIGLRAGAMTRACLLIAQLPFKPLPIPHSWKSRRNQKLYGEMPSGGYRLVVFHPGYPIDPATLAEAANSLSLNDLEPRLHPKRDLVGFLHTATQLGCQTYFADNNGSADAVERFHQLLTAVGADGAAIINPQKYSTSESLVAGLRRQGLSFITVLNHCGTLADASVECNDAASGYAAMKVLLEHGHRDILLISKPPNRSDYFLRCCENGVMACLADSGLAETVRLRKRSADRNHIEANRSMLEPIFRDRDSWPTAMLFLDTMPFIGADCVMAEYGVRVPQDISVIACGPPAHKSPIYGLPDVMERNRTELGVAAAHQLVRLIRGFPVPRTLQMQMPYIRRGTVRELL